MREGRAKPGETFYSPSVAAPPPASIDRKGRQDSPEGFIVMRSSSPPVKRAAEPPAVPPVSAERAEVAGAEDLRERLRAIVDKKALKTDGPYPLSAGGESSFLFDLKPVMLDPEGGELLGTLLMHAAHALGATHVGGREIGAVPLAALAARASHGSRKPLLGFFVRKQPKAHGLRVAVEGNVPRDADVVIVEDVTTTGKSVLETIRALDGLGARVLGVVTVVDRGEGAAATFAREDIRFQALLLREDFPRLAALKR